MFTFDQHFTFWSIFVVFKRVWRFWVPKILVDHRPCPPKAPPRPLHSTHCFFFLLGVQRKVDFSVGKVGGALGRYNRGWGWGGTWGYLYSPNWRIPARALAQLQPIFTPGGRTVSEAGFANTFLPIFDFLRLLAIFDEF